MSEDFAAQYGRKFRMLRRLARLIQKYHVPGTDRVLRLIYSPDKRQHDFVDAVIEYDSTMLIQTNTASYFEWEIFFYGYYEQQIDRLIKRLVRAGDTVFDVGANVGSHTLIMRKCVGNAGHVIAVEPNPRIYSRLNENVVMNRFADNVTLLQMALSHTSGTGRLFLPPSDYPNQGISSLHKRPELEGDVVVPLHRFDDVVYEQECSRVDFVKIDTEGHDYEVLLGAEGSIAEYHPYLLFEYDEHEWAQVGSDFAACANLLHKEHYTLYILEPTGSLIRIESNVPSYANIVAVPQRR